MHDTPFYTGPADPDEIDIEDVHEALEFLIAIGPDPEDDDNDIDTYEDYKAYMAPFSQDIARAIATLRGAAAAPNAPGDAGRVLRPHERRALFRYSRDVSHRHPGPAGCLESRRAMAEVGRRPAD